MRSAFVETYGLVAQGTELSQARPGVHDLPQFADPSAVHPCEEGLVDLDAERARLAREREKVASEHGRLERKLGNAGFLSKAAPEIIDKDRARLAELADARATIDAQLAELA